MMLSIHGAGRCTLVLHLERVVITYTYIVLGVSVLYRGLLVDRVRLRGVARII